MKDANSILKAKMVLGLGDRVTLEEIKYHYKALMKKWHPDKNPQNLQKAQEMSHLINESYTTLMEFIKGYEYDLSEKEVKKYMSPEEWWKSRFS